MISLFGAPPVRQLSRSSDEHMSFGISWTSILQAWVASMQLWGPFQLHKLFRDTICPQAQAHRDSWVARKRLIPPSLKDDYGQSSSFNSNLLLYYVTMFHIPTIKLPPHFTAPVLLIISRTYQLSLYRQPFPDIKINDTCHNVIRS